jgi:3'-5' exoribonuclease
MGFGQAITSKMKKQYTNEIKVGHSVDDVFVLLNKALFKKKDGNNFLNVTLADKTGNLKGVMWDHVDQVIAAGVSSGDFVHIMGNVNEYRGERQLVIKKMRTCPPDSIDFSDFLPKTGHNIENMFNRLVELTAALKTEHLKELFSQFWNDEGFVHKFKTAPAAKNMHHAYIGGLLEHTLSMAILVERIAGHYAGIDMDLLLSGVILHDIGKIKEFEYNHRIDYSDEGRLLSHIVIGLQMLENKIENVIGFPEEQALLLKHLIVSHHGAREFGSPELPKTVEAFLLNYIDEIDSKVNGIRDFISSEDPNESWTSYHKVLGRHFYTGKRKEDFKE